MSLTGPVFLVGIVVLTVAAFAMHRQIGRARVAARIAELNTQCKAGLAANPRVKLHTPMSAGL